MTNRLAVYTVVHPGVRNFLAAWYKSITNQTDRRFDLWISVDGLEVSEVVSLFGDTPRAEWLLAKAGETPAEIRLGAMRELVGHYASVVFVDSDDVLDPSRIEFARKALDNSDLAGCALSVIDEAGQQLGMRFQPGQEEDLGSLLVRCNVFGLSNTSYRADTLRSCLPFGRDCALPDWFLATSAWSCGARLSFDFTPRMLYRQYPANTARVLPPFSAEDLRRASRLVSGHYEGLKDRIREATPVKRHALEVAAERAQLFCRVMLTDQGRLERYVEALNRLTPRYVWWWAVANSQLENLWKT